MDSDSVLVHHRCLSMRMESVKMQQITLTVPMLPYAMIWRYTWRIIVFLIVNPVLLIVAEAVAGTTQWPGMLAGALAVFLNFMLWPSKP